MSECKLACDSSSKNLETLQCSQAACTLGFGNSHLYLQRTVQACVCLHERKMLNMRPEGFIYILQTICLTEMLEICKLLVNLQQVHFPLSHNCRLVDYQQDFTAISVLLMH